MSGSDIAQDYRTFADACSWVDEVRRTTHRETYQYHFINTPKTEALDLTRDCARYDCVSQAIQRYALDLNDSNTRPDDRKEALMFLGHFVADIHQPLHVGNGEDLGGNRINVYLSEDKIGEPINLHAMWDHELLKRNDVFSRNNQQLLLKRIKEGGYDKNIETTNISVWAAESHQLARGFAYRFPDDSVIADGDGLTTGYYETAKPVIEAQLIKSIIRLRLLLQLSARQALSPPLLD